MLSRISDSPLFSFFSISHCPWAVKRVPEISGNIAHWDTHVASCRLVKSLCCLEFQAFFFYFSFRSLTAHRQSATYQTDTIKSKA